MELTIPELGGYAASLADGLRRNKLVTWSDKLAVGIRVMDEQHMTLIDLANQLSDAMYLGRGQDMLEKALSALEAYAMHHFDTEEKLMAEHGYVETEAHKGGHLFFNVAIRRFRRRSETGETVFSAEILFFLREWIISHIMQSDKELGLALKQCGAR